MLRRTILKTALAVLPRPYAYEVWDVFTDKAFGGNPLAVFLDANGLSTEQMFAITRELNHSETTFVTQGDKVRIFTATQELPFAGHPVLGTAFALRQREIQAGRRAPAQVMVNVPQGPVPVVFSEAANKSITGMMRQSDPIFAETHEKRYLAYMLGVSESDLAENHPVQNVSTGRPNLIVLLKDKATFARLKLNWTALTEYFERGDVQRGLYFLAAEKLADTVQFHARKLTPRLEDPATGSAAGCAIAYLVRHGLAPTGQVVKLFQGEFVKRPSEILLSAEAIAGGAVTNVRVGGNCVRVMEGRVIA
jgi:trans-2,3-dihydro-3-hydroxyanthranilate isomerase